MEIVLVCSGFCPGFKRYERLREAWRTAKYHTTPSAVEGCSFVLLFLKNFLAQWAVARHHATVDGRANTRAGLVNRSVMFGSLWFDLFSFAYAAAFQQKKKSSFTSTIDFVFSEINIITGLKKYQQF
jgi:hypothetical protein